MEASVDWMLEIGPEVIERRVLELADSARSMLRALGGSVDDTGSQVVIAGFPGMDASATARALREQKVVIAARHGRLRISPHFYNDEGDLKRLKALLKNCCEYRLPAKRLARVAIRGAVLLRAPLAAAVMIAILAAGIGLNTAVYSVLYGILLRPYPYASPERIVRIASAPVKDPGNRVGVSLPDFEDFRHDARTVQDLSAWTTERINLIDNGAAVPVDAGVISPGLFATLGVKLAWAASFCRRRIFPGGDVNKVILSHALWEKRFQRDPGFWER